MVGMFVMVCMVICIGRDVCSGGVYVGVCSGRDVCSGRLLCSGWDVCSGKIYVLVGMCSSGVCVVVRMCVLVGMCVVVGCV